MLVEIRQESTRVDIIVLKTPGFGLVWKWNDLEGCHVMEGRTELGWHEVAVEMEPARSDPGKIRTCRCLDLGP
jgi:hypothetical protein